MNTRIGLYVVTTPALVTAAGERANVRFLEFFASNIRNPNTRRPYAHAVGEFLAWCGQAGVVSITAVQPLHVATWIELQTQTLSAPTVKQHLGGGPASIRLARGRAGRAAQSGRVRARAESHGP